MFTKTSTLTTTSNVQPTQFQKKILIPWTRKGRNTEKTNQSWSFAYIYNSLRTKADHSRRRRHHLTSSVVCFCTPFFYLCLPPGSWKHTWLTQLVISGLLHFSVQRTATKLMVPFRRPLYTIVLLPLPISSYRMKFSICQLTAHRWQNSITSSCRGNKNSINTSSWPN